MRELKIFSGRANPQLAKDICDFLHLDLGSIELGKFPDGENFCKIQEDVRGRDVYLIQPTCPPVNDNLLELLIMIDSCKRASAARITAVIPYYGYARQDRKDEGRVPITAKLVANLITRAGADRVLAMDLHAPQIQGFFDVPVDHLYAAPALTKYFQNQAFDPEDIVVVSPDEGSIKRAFGHSKRIGGKLAIIDKHRENAVRTQQKNIIGGPVEGKAGPRSRCSRNPFGCYPRCPLRSRDQIAPRSPHQELGDHQHDPTHPRKTTGQYPCPHRRSTPRRSHPPDPLQ
jgi:ribose-phosphate pyrophosphokinase